jgi:hypothetical protein
MPTDDNSARFCVSVNLLNVTNFSRPFKKYDKTFMFVKAIVPKGQGEAIAQVTLNL